MTFYDILVLIVVLISALTGLVRGGAREMISLVSFFLSVLIGLWLLPLIAPFAKDALKPEWLGALVAFLVVSLSAYGLLRILGQWMSQKLRDSNTMGGIDRMMGLGFGLIRAFVVVGVFHLIVFAAIPASRAPAWMVKAKVFPVSVAAAKTLQAVLPKGAAVADRLAPTISQKAHEGFTAPAHSNPDRTRNTAREK